MKEKGVSLESAQAAKPRAAQIFAPLVGEDVAVGIARMDDDGFCLKVNLTSDPGQDVELPGEVEGVPVRVEVVGVIRKR
jgi:hypothetical protein